jgi:CRISPR-associated endonuclease/helicase Cas3
MKIEQKLAEKAFERGIENKAARVLVYCDSRKSALQVKKDIDKKLHKKNILGSSELMVGGRRVHERERLQGWLEENGYASEIYSVPDVPTFLVATSAGEVGVDLDADHLVCDLVPFERMVQRLGRVSRREAKGRTAYIDVFYNAAKDEKENKTAEYQRLYSCKNVLKQLPSVGTDYYHASPLELSNIMRNGLLGNGLDNDNIIKKAFTPAPLRPSLTRPIVESWALTGIEENEGRPEVSPWLRGWVDEDPQVEVAWRRWLPWRYGESEPNKSEAEYYLAKVPIHLREVLQVPPEELLKTLSSRAQKVVEDTNKESENDKTISTENDPALLFFNKRGRLSGSMTVGKLAKYQYKKSKEKKQIDQSITGHKILVSTKIGGLNEDGLLDENADSVSGLDHLWEEEVQVDIGYITKGPEEPEPEGRIWKRVGTVPLSNPESSDSVDIPLISMYVARGRNNSREGNWAISNSLQTLEEHHDSIIDHAGKIAVALNLPENCTRILETAARYHDLGKKRELWQRAMNAPPDAVYAKTNSGADTRLLNGYRHEFGSLHDLKQSIFLESFEKEEQDLILHLIAAHHGHARPFIPSFDPEISLKERKNIAYETSLRFARLQREWGVWGLAWWENLLRSVDHAVSSKLDEMGLEEKGGE